MPSSFAATPPPITDTTCRGQGIASRILPGRSGAAPLALICAPAQHAGLGASMAPCCNSFSYHDVLGTRLRG